MVGFGEQSPPFAEKGQGCMATPRRAPFSFCDTQPPFRDGGLYGFANPSLYLDRFFTKVSLHHGLEPRSAPVYQHRLRRPSVLGTYVE